METDKLATLVPNPKTGSFFLHQDEARVQIDFLLNPHEDDKMYYKTRWFTHKHLLTALVPMQMSFSGKCVRTMLGDCSMVMRDLAWMSWKERAFVILSVKSIRKYCIQRKQKYPVQIQLTAPWDKYQIEKQFKLLKLEMFFFNSGKACRVLKRVSEDAWTSYTWY